MSENLTSKPEADKSSGQMIRMALACMERCVLGCIVIRF